MPEEANSFLVRGLVDEDVTGEVKDIAQGGGQGAFGTAHLVAEHLVVGVVAQEAERIAAALGRVQKAARRGLSNTGLNKGENTAHHFAVSDTARSGARRDSDGARHG